MLLRALRNRVIHQSANQAGSLAFSWLPAMFPLLVLVSASAGHFGQPGEAAALVERVPWQLGGRGGDTLYISATTLIFGAEIDGALRETGRGVSA